MRQQPFSSHIVARDPSEPNRTSTTLELLFDLVYVIAVSAAAKGFHYRLVEHDVMGFVTFGVAFFILWNAWTSFTWFASGYDPDDVYYRLSVLLQMFGSLLIAANIHLFFEHGLVWIGVTGYTIMRLAICSQWWRVYRHVPSHKKVAGRSFVGLLSLQLLWISWLFLPQSWQTPALFLFILGELLMPIWARSEQFDNWHPGHIAERYGLLTIIVLGEGILGVSGTIGELLTNPNYSASAIIASGSALVALLFAIWWLYFNIPFATILDSEHRRHDFVSFGYGHFFIFASLAGLGSALNLVADLVDKTSTSAMTSATGSSTHPLTDVPAGVSATYAMGMILLQLLIFLITLTCLRRLMCDKSGHNLMALSVAMLIIAVSFFAVQQGLSITYGIWLTVLAPVVMIVLFRRDEQQWQG